MCALTPLLIQSLAALDADAGSLVDHHARDTEEAPAAPCRCAASLSAYASSRELAGTPA